jgi:hypothetical protein
VLVESGVLFHEFLLVLGHVFQSVDRVGSAGWNTSAAVDTSLGIDIHLSRGCEAFLLLLRMDAIGGADLDAQGIFDAGISNYIGHDEVDLPSEISVFVSLKNECKNPWRGEAVIAITSRCASVGMSEHI